MRNKDISDITKEFSAAVSATPLSGSGLDSSPSVKAQNTSAAQTKQPTERIEKAMGFNVKPVAATSSVKVQSGKPTSMAMAQQAQAPAVATEKECDNAIGAFTKELDTVKREASAAIKGAGGNVATHYPDTRDAPQTGAIGLVARAIGDGVLGGLFGGKTAIASSMRAVPDFASIANSLTGSPKEVQSKIDDMARSTLVAASSPVQESSPPQIQPINDAFMAMNNAPNNKGSGVSSSRFDWQSAFDAGHDLHSLLYMNPQDQAFCQEIMAVKYVATEVKDSAIAAEDQAINDGMSLSEQLNLTFGSTYEIKGVQCDFETINVLCTDMDIKQKAALMADSNKPEYRPPEIVPSMTT